MISSELRQLKRLVLYTRSVIIYPISGSVIIYLMFQDTLVNIRRTYKVS